MRLTLHLLLLVALLLGAGCMDKTSPVHDAQILAFGTLIDVSIAGKPLEEAQAAVVKLEGAFAEMHKNWHAWDPGPLQQTNQKLQKGISFEPDPLVMPLITLSIPLAIASEHLFNPAIGHLIDIWGFQGNQLDCSRLPSDDLISKQLRMAPRMTDLKLENGLLRSDNPDVKLDFGAVGKGYGVDLAIQILRNLGVDNAIINAGGDLRAIGNRGGRPWRIAVRHPAGGILGSLEVEGDESVFTSGDYERKYQCDGKTYHHIIDPRTGYPAQGTSSVTVIHPDAATADAAATALFIAGPEDWQRIAKRMGIRYVALLDSQGRLHMNPAMAKRLHLLNDQIPVEISEPLSEH